MLVVRCQISAREVIRAGLGSGLVAVGASPDYEVVGLQPPVVPAADGDKIVDVGSATVAVPFADVVEFASVHRGTAFEASAVSYGNRQSLGCVAEALVPA